MMLNSTQRNYLQTLVDKIKNPVTLKIRVRQYLQKSIYEYEIIEASAYYIKLCMYDNKNNTIFEEYEFYNVLKLREIKVKKIMEKYAPK